jgi:hypothetical protein
MQYAVPLAAHAGSSELALFVILVSPMRGQGSASSTGRSANDALDREGKAKELILDRQHLSIRQSQVLRSPNLC